MVKKPKNQHNKLHKKITKSGKNRDKEVKVIFGSILDRLEAIQKELNDMTQFFEEIVINLYGEQSQTTVEQPKDKKPQPYIT